jgi:hypothetical protein
MHTLHDQHEPAPKMRHLNERCLMTAISSNDLVHRVQVATESDALKSDPGLRRCTWELELGPWAWSHLSPEEGERRVLEGGSLWCRAWLARGRRPTCNESLSG